MMNVAAISSNTINNAINFELNVDTNVVLGELKLGALVGLTYGIPLVGFVALGRSLEWGLVSSGLASFEGALAAAALTMVAPAVAAGIGRKISSKKLTALLILSGAAGQIAGIALCG